MVSRENPFDPEFLAMTPEERREHFRKSRVADRADLPEEARRRFDAMHEIAQQDSELTPTITAD